jgi:CubicO group peptidase (beta-lactamase class C family)
MAKWLPAALDYIGQWLDFQLRSTGQPGCVVAVAEKGEVVLERAFGTAALGGRTALTPRHRFRVASHSKTFTAAGILKLREEGKLNLDDPAGRHVEGLDPGVGAATLAQLLSHSAGVTRDGDDTGQWMGRRAFLNQRELRAALARPTPIEANTRFKYSNHGFGLLGLVIEAVTGEAYGDWIRRAIVEPAGLTETAPDMPAAGATPLASGHSGELPLGRRVVIPGDTPTHALASATGFVSTAADLARFFGQLDPAAKRSILSVASRREMTRPQWRNPDAEVERHYGLGTTSGRTGGLDWFGHGGAFPGYISRTLVLPGHDLAVSVVTNAIDGLANPWAEGAAHIFAAFARHGAPTAKVEGWAGRWWSIWRAGDLVPMGGKVLLADPALATPFLDAAEITPTGPDEGRITRAQGYNSHGEDVRLVRDRKGTATELWYAGSKLVPEAKLAAEMKKRHGGQGR